MDLIIRKEEKKDYEEVEQMTREAFWDIYRPGCEEHLLVHKLRSYDKFIKNLDFVATINQKIVGNVMSCYGSIIDGDITHEVICLGPLTVLPEYQNKGIGKALLKKSIEESKKLHTSLIAIYGNPDYYSKSGFVKGKLYNITSINGEYYDALQVYILDKEKVDKENIRGKLFEGLIFEINQDELIEFEKNFPYKEKKFIPRKL